MICKVVINQNNNNNKDPLAIVPTGRAEGNEYSFCLT